MLRLARDYSQDRITVCTVLDLVDGSVFAEFRYGALTRATTHVRDVFVTLGGVRYYAPVVRSDG